MKKLISLLVFAFVFCSCELLPPKTEDTTTYTDTAVVTTYPASTAFVPDGGTALSDRYVGEGYIACKFSDEDGENICFAVHLDNGQSIRIDRDETVSVLPALSEMVYFPDINFDGLNDLCILLGGFGAQGVTVFKGYICINGKYELCEGFDEISNPVLDKENKLILSTSRVNAAQHLYSKYKVEDGKVTELESVIYNVADETVQKGCLVAPASDFADWDFVGAKWSNIIGRTPKKEYLAKTTPYYIAEKTHGVNVQKYEFTSDGGLLETNGQGYEGYYNSLGQRYKEVWSGGQKAFYTYDENGKLEKYEQYDSDGNLVEKETYIDGKRLSKEDNEGSFERYEYDEEGRLVKREYRSVIDDTRGFVEYSYDESGNLVYEKQYHSESGYSDTEDIYEYEYDGNGKLILGRYGGTLTDGEIYDCEEYTYYDSGELKTEKFLGYGSFYRLMYFEYSKSGDILIYAYGSSYEFAELNIYEEVYVYTYYDDGRIKSADLYRRAEPEDDYSNIRRIEVSYKEDGTRIEDHYASNREMELEPKCTVALEYDNYGNLVSRHYVIDGDMVLEFSYVNSDFNYYVTECKYDEYGRITYKKPANSVAESYVYADCTPEQYELYQKVVDQQ